MMNENTLMIILFLVIFAASGVIYFTRNNQSQILVPETERQEITIEKDVGTENPENVVELFLINFFKTAPPESDQQALDIAVSLLSEEAKMQVGDEPTSGDLARLVGVQDIPDQGYQISDISFTDNIDEGYADVEVTLKYSGGDAIRNFELSKIDGSWLIDNIN